MGESTYLLDSYVFTQAGEPFRLFPFGQLVKDGKVREITRELAAMFKLPHFRPPIKLGSHKDETRAGGHIVGLEVREDGLYAIPEFTDEGRAAMERGDYRYHSPEIIWEGWLEDPTTGDPIEGPLIIGDALLHTPHLGEAAALYRVDIGDEAMTTHDDMVSVSLLERLRDFFAAPQYEQEPEPQVMTQTIEPPEPVETFAAEYQAAQAQVEQLTARLAEVQQAQARGERIAHLAAELATLDDAELCETLADLPEETAALLTARFKALAAQADASGLTEDVGDAGVDVPGTPADRFNAAVDAEVEKGMDRMTAVRKVLAEQPDILKE
jgi:hypothetical protein